MFLYLNSEKKSVIVNTDKIISIHENDEKTYIELGRDYVEIDYNGADFAKEFTRLNFDVQVAIFKVNDVKIGVNY